MDPRYKQWTIRSAKNRDTAITKLKQTVRCYVKNNFSADEEEEEETAEGEVEEVASDDKNSGFSSVFARICATQEKEADKDVPEVTTADDVVEDYLKEPLLGNNKVLLYWRAYKEAANGKNTN